MPVPEFYHFLRPTLTTLGEGGDHSLKSIRTAVFAFMELTSEELKEMTLRQRNTKAVDRVNWALAYLKGARLIDQPKRGFYFITERGRDYLSIAPQVVTPKDLERFPEFKIFQKGKGGREESGGVSPDQDTDSITPTSTPEETMQIASALIRKNLADEVLDQVKSMSPAFFERLIVELMLKLGYGGPSSQWGKVTGRTGDNGVDGVIDQDRLGLDKIYLQAKRYTSGSVGSEEVRAFVGALIGQGARKGVLITTSDFSTSARGYVASLGDYKISLITGIELAKLMIDYDLGVALATRYDVKRLDSDYFTE